MSIKRTPEIPSFPRISSTARHLLGEPVHDLDAGEIALVHRAVEGLACERLLVDRAVRVAVEEAAQLVLELVDPLDRERHQLPCEVLVGQPLAALDRVHEVPLDRIFLRERDVVATLHHARAAAFAEQAFYGDRDRQIRRSLVRVQRGEQARAAGTEDQDVGIEASGFLDHCVAATTATRTKPMTSKSVFG
jgi:hypothetical protein